MAPKFDHRKDMVNVTDKASPMFGKFGHIKGEPRETPAGYVYTVVIGGFYGPAKVLEFNESHLTLDYLA